MERVFLPREAEKVALVWLGKGLAASQAVFETHEEAEYLGTSSTEGAKQRIQLHSRVVLCNNQIPSQQSVHLNLHHPGELSSCSAVI